MVGASMKSVSLIPKSIVAMADVTTTRIATHVRAIAVHVLTAETVSVTGVRTAMRVQWTVAYVHTAEMIAVMQAKPANLVAETVVVAL
jgi:hypothetical protein